MHPSPVVRASRLTIILSLALLIILNQGQVNSAPGAVILGSRAGAGPEPEFLTYLPYISHHSNHLGVFGVEMTRLAPSDGINEMIEANAQWFRRNALLWSDISPNTANQRDWAAVADLDAELLNAANVGITPILIVRSTPDWAQKVEGFPCGPMRAQYFDEFADFMVDAVDRYSQPPYNVEHWEIWNEPDLKVQAADPEAPYGCWGDRFAENYAGGHYGAMLKVVYPAVKAANPNITLMVGGLLLGCNPDNPPADDDCEHGTFFDGILETGAGKFFDGVSYHSYDFYNPVLDLYGNPAWFTGMIQGTGNLLPGFRAKANFLRARLASYGFVDKEILLSEMALLCGGANDPPGGPGCESHDTSPFEVMKASYMLQSFATLIHEDLLAGIWHSSFGWRNSGLLNPDRSARPALVAFTFAESKLNVPPINSRHINEISGLAGYEFDYPQELIWIVWSKQAVPFEIEVHAVPDHAFHPIGVEFTVSTTTVTVSEHAIYLIWDK
jgi:hypothetical protein